MHEKEASTLQWIDGSGRTWSVDLSHELVALNDGEVAIELPRVRWATDISVHEHGPRFILRLSTDIAEIGFILTADEAQPFLQHVGASLQAGERKAEEEEDAEPVRRELIWPKVSPLAVWALMTSALVFVPIIGLIAAVVTVVLLVQHRRTVRRAAAWDHSRTLCKVAVAFLVVGLSVESLLAVRIYYVPHDARSLDVDVPAGEGLMPDAFDPEQAAMNAPPLLGQFSNVNLGLLAAGLFVVIVSLSVHEAAHAISAWWLGDDFAKRLGRVTFNPIMHIDPIGTILLPLILFIAGAGVFGWAKPVPIRAEVTKRPRRTHILVSLAGPGSNLLMASASLALLLAIVSTLVLVVPAVSIVGLGIYAGESLFGAVAIEGVALAEIVSAVCTLLKYGFLVNVFLACFNLIPIPPLDGSWVLEHLFPRTLGPFYARIRPYGFIVFLVLLYTNMIGYLLAPVVLFLSPAFALLGFAAP